MDLRHLVAPEERRTCESRRMRIRLTRSREDEDKIWFSHEGTKTRRKNEYAGIRDGIGPMPSVRFRGRPDRYGLPHLPTVRPAVFLKLQGVPQTPALSAVG